MDAAHVESVFRHDRLLGTVVDVRIRAATRQIGEAVDESIVATFRRLESIFSIYDDQSELSRWKRDLVHEPSAELVEVMSAALDWQVHSAGAFNPMSGLLTRLWRQAERDQVGPSDRSLHEAARSIEEPRYAIQNGLVRRIGDCAELDLNAIAKGYIVDRVCDHAVDHFDISMLLVSAGGDMAHRGEPSSRIGIENPLRPYDNEPPLAIIDLHDAGLATSGGARRGFRIGNDRFSHIIDPRTARPVSHPGSITVTAPTTMSADVSATLLGISEPADAMVASEELLVACLIVAADGSLWPNGRWSAEFGAPRPST